MKLKIVDTLEFLLFLLKFILFLPIMIIEIDKILFLIDNENVLKKHADMLNILK